ncbi:MAG: M14 family zinc carboxypeptidase [Patiriisocius sp.]|uniref:M14 family zinc carboxypeptidase n=1 Tax=Patiriisocius sp. TaxID=2822396 RepID=UPI003EF917FC
MNYISTLVLFFCIFTFNINAQINYYCEPSDLVYETPTNYRSGSLAGIYLTYQEMLDDLDRMKSLYPDLITSKSPIGDFRTEGTPNDSVSPSIGNNPIYWVKISKNPDINEDEPQVLYDSQVHGDEWGSMHQNIFFMWYLLENYGKDEKITAIINNVELYFIPTLNVDGFLFSEFTYNKYGTVTGGRKNRHDAFGDYEGVDINRNFNRFVDGDPNQSTWGLGDIGGILSNPNSYSYAGTEAFSEIESQAYKWFVEQHNFSFNITSHNSHGDDFTTSANIPYHDNQSINQDKDYYTNSLYQLSNLTRVGRTVGSNRGGLIPDFNYGTENNHEPIISILTETSSAPGLIVDSRQRLDSINKEMITNNLAISQLSLPFTIAKDKQNPFVGNSLNTQVAASIQRLGRGDGDYTVYVEPVSENVQQNLSKVTVEDLDILEERDVILDISLSNDVNYGDEISYNIVIDNGLYKTWKKINKIFGKPITTSIYSEGDFNEVFDIVGDTIWSVSGDEFTTPPNAIIGKTENDSISYLISKTPLNLQGAAKAVLRYQTKYNLFNFLSFIQFQVSEDQENWITLCGNLTKYNYHEENTNIPGYYNTLIDWSQEEIDLNEFLDKTVYYRFAFDPNPYNTEVNFLIDEISLEILTNDAGNDTDYLIFPNPTSSILNIETDQKNYNIFIFDILGQLLLEQNNMSFAQTLDVESYSSGIYFLRMEKGNDSRTFKIIKN